MRWTIIGFLSLVVLITQTSCGQASFTGNGNGSSSNPPANQTPAGTGTTPTGTNPGTTPGTTTTVPTTPGTTTPGGSNTNPNGTSTSTPTGTAIPGITYPGTTSPGYSPGIPGAPDHLPVPGCTGAPCESGIPTPTYGPIGQVSQPTPNSMIFGGTRSFHIGDGRFENTSCRAQVASLPLNGSVYFYQFQVMQDNTTVTINVSGVCGVDYMSNTLQLAQIAQTNSKVGQIAVPVGASNLGLPSAVLNRGVYAVYIYSGRGDSSRGQDTDFDDFVIGRVQINGNQQVMPIDYGAF